MKALVFDKYGKAEDVLALKDLPEPEPAAGEVKVKMLYSPVNPSDLVNTIEGTYRDAIGKAIWNYGKPVEQFSIDPDGQRMFPATLPRVPGLEGVGIVIKAGAGWFPKLLMNKRVTVIGANRGSWQQYTVVDARQALPVKNGISDEQAAVSFVNPVTAYAMTREVLKCGHGDLVLQSAANSEVGKMIIRLGKHYGFQTINLIRNQSQAAHLTSIGATHIIDIATENLRERVFQISGGKGVKFALDPIGGPLASEILQCLALNGKLLVYGTLSAQPLTFSSRDLMTPLSSVQGFFLTNWISQHGLFKKLSITRKVAGLVKSGVLQSQIHKTFPTENYHEAISEVHQSNNRGKILLKLN